MQYHKFDSKRDELKPGVKIEVAGKEGVIVQILEGRHPHVVKFSFKTVDHPVEITMDVSGFSSLKIAD